MAFDHWSAKAPRAEQVAAMELRALAKRRGAFDAGETMRRAAIFGIQQGALDERLRQSSPTR